MLACRRRNFHSGFHGALRSHSARLTPVGPYAPVGGFSGTTTYGPHLQLGRADEQPLLPVPRSLPLIMVSDPAGFPGRLPLGSTLRRAFHALGCLWLRPERISSPNACPDGTNPV